MPKRIQRQRTKGWRMPENTVYVGRPSRWGNAYRLRNAPLDHPNPHQWLVDAHRSWLNWCGPIKAAEIRTYLRGKNLACWCPLDQPCHADVLLEIANGAGA
ncbi:DUF4326 domain-containing protein [Micromonospora sp. URMC 103]